MKRKCSDTKKFYLLYTGLFITFFGVAFFSFFSKGKSVVWRTDGFTQHYPALLYLKSWAGQLLSNIRAGKFEIPMWSMRIGEGSDFLTVFNFRPLYLLSLFWKREHLEQFFWVRLFISMYMAGITFSCYCSAFKKKDYAVLFASLVYVYAGYILCYSFKHSFFIEASIFFPLLLLGAEKILRGERQAVFLLSVGYLAASYFYMLYMLSFFCGCYVLIRFFFTGKRRQIKSFLCLLAKFCRVYVCGLALAGFAIIPNLLLVLASSRTGDASKQFVGLFYDLKYYITLITSVSGIESVGEYGYCLVSAAALLLFLKVWIVQPNNRRTQLKLAGILGLVFCCFPFFAALVNGMASVTNRWFFVVAFGGALVVAFEFDSIKIINRHELAGLYLIVQIYAVVCLCFHFLFDTGVLFISFLFVYLLLLCLEMKWKISGSVWGKSLFLAVFLAEIGVHSYMFYNVSAENIIEQYIDAGKLEQEEKNIGLDALQDLEDDTVYRIDAVEMKESAPYLNRNYGLRKDCNGISTYCSYASAGLIRTIADLGVSQRFNDFAISSYDQRAALDTLSSVKYAAVSKKRQACVPYGFKKIGERGPCLIYKNENTLPIFYTYDYIIPQKEYRGLSVNEKEQAMLQGAVIDSDFLPERTLSFQSYEAISHNEVFAQMKMQLGEACRMDSHSVRVDGGQKTVKIKLPKKISGELYIKLEGAEYEDVSLKNYISGKNLLSGIRAYIRDVRSVSTHFGVVSARFKEVGKVSYLFGKGHQYYGGAKDSLIHLGYVEDGQGEITIQFRKNGNFYLPDISVVVQPMEEFASQVDALRADVSGIAVDGNTVRAKVCADKKKILCIAVPYLDGWSALVDGKKQELKVLNGRYMGLELEKGRHQIKLRYHTPGLKIGAAVSCGTVIILCIRIRMRRKGRKI
ncbi:MAG: YfhO family protein [Eubacterium sp.]|nr:YfhO family protein [Eubacterium sp.]